MKELKKRLEIILAGTGDIIARLAKVCQLLDAELDYYNWAGFYFRDGEKEELILGPFVGAETDHTRIPFGKGICGQVAVSGKTFIAQDVQQQENYLACSLDTRSEIVVPIFRDRKNIGQIDIDSHKENAFSEKDKDLLEWLAEKVGEIM